MEEKQKAEIITLNVGGRKFPTLNITVKDIMDKIVQSELTGTANCFHIS
jgi:hypothetical protein